MEATSDLGGVVALKVRDVGIAFERWQRDVAEDFFAAAFGEQVFGKRETMVVSRDEADEHHRFGAVVEQAVQSFERTLAVVGEQVIAEFEV